MAMSYSEQEDLIKKKLYLHLTTVSFVVLPQLRSLTVSSLGVTITPRGTQIQKHTATNQYVSYLYYHVNSGDSNIQMSLEGSHSIDNLPGPSRMITDLVIVEIQTVRIPFEKLKVPSHDRFVAGQLCDFNRTPPDTQSLPLLYYHPLIEYRLPIEEFQRITSCGRFTMYLHLHSPTPWQPDLKHVLSQALAIPVDIEGK